MRRAGRGRDAGRVPGAPRCQDACRKAKNSDFTRTAAPRCVQEGKKQRLYPHRCPEMRAERQKSATLPTTLPRDACRKAKISSFTRTAAPRCVQEGRNQQFYPRRLLQMRAERQKSAVLPALPPPDACRKAKNSDFTRTALKKNKSRRCFLNPWAKGACLWFRTSLSG